MVLAVLALAVILAGAGSAVMTASAAPARPAPARPADWSGKLICTGSVCWSSAKPGDLVYGGHRARVRKEITYDRADYYCANRKHPGTDDLVQKGCPFTFSEGNKLAKGSEIIVVGSAHYQDFFAGGTSGDSIVQRKHPGAGIVWVAYETPTGLALISVRASNKAGILTFACSQGPGLPLYSGLEECLWATVSH
jgi:hypothetical protein